MNVLIRNPLEQVGAVDPGREFYRKVDEWAAGGLRLERPNESALHHLKDADRECRVYGVIGCQARLPERLNTFVIQHNWAAAFEGATDFADGDFQAPYECATFEFRVSGKRVVALLEDFEMDGVNKRALVPFVEFDGYWLQPEHSYECIEGEWFSTSEGMTVDVLEPLKQLMVTQIRAVCISLEAQVATTDIVKAPEKLNRSRAKNGRAELSDYHVVRLNRERVFRHSHGDGHEPGTSRRLHFRRGHWRHLDEERRTWIKWMLVGNPDLGFVNKEYRL